MSQISEIKWNYRYVDDDYVPQEVKKNHPPREWSHNFWSTSDIPETYLTLINADGSKNENYIKFCTQNNAYTMTEDEIVSGFIRQYGADTKEPILAHPRWLSALERLGLKIYQ